MTKKWRTCQRGNVSTHEEVLADSDVQVVNVPVPSGYLGIVQLGLVPLYASPKISRSKIIVFTSRHD